MVKEHDGESQILGPPDESCYFNMGGGYLVLKAVLSLFTACFAHSPFTSPDSNRNERRFQGHGFLKRRLLLQNGLKENDVRDIFAHGEPLVFDKEDFPRLIVPKIVEVCRG